MNEQAYSFIIPGDPTPLARCRFGKGRVWDSQKQIKLTWGISLKSQLNQALKKLLPHQQKPLGLDAIFYFRIPATAKNKKTHKSEGNYHFYKPDASNLVKFVEDAANGILFKDDCLIAHINAEKRYSAQPRTEFTLHILGEK